MDQIVSIKNAYQVFFCLLDFSHEITFQHLINEKNEKNIFSIKNNGVWYNSRDCRINPPNVFVFPFSMQNTSMKLISFNKSLSIEF